MSIGETRIIAVSGHPGSGKSTLARGLATRLRCPVVHFDDFETITQLRSAEVERWIANGADFDAIDLSSLVAELEREASKGASVIVLDTLVGRVHGQTGGLIDTLLWVDTPADIALARKLRDAAVKAGEDNGPAFTRWVASWLGYYERFIAKTNVIQRERVLPGADLVLDGRQPAHDVLEQASAAAFASLQQPAQVQAKNWGQAVLTQVHGLGVAFGLERSVKLESGTINTDRFLALVHKNAFGAAPARKLAAILDQLAFPPGDLAALLNGVAEADLIHFGYEGGSGGEPILKVYLEYTGKLRQAERPDGPERVPVYRAVKWRPGDPAGKWSNYERLRDAGSADKLPLPHTAWGRGVAEICAIAARRADPAKMLALHIAEEGTPKHSVDVNLYPAGLTVDAVAPAIEAFAASTGIGSDALGKLLRDIGKKRLGHVSAGQGRSYKDFLTVYFGIEERGANR